MQLSQRKAGSMYREITSDLSLIPQEDYLKVASMILKLDPQERRDDEIQALQKLTEELQFFKSINSKKVNVRNKLHYKICSKMKYEASQKGQAIIEYGAKADKFFVLLKGSVIVYLTKSTEILQNDIQEEMRFQEENNITPLYLTQKEQKRAFSISSSQSQSPTNKISFLKSNSILTVQAGGGQSSPLTRVNSGHFDSIQTHKKSIVKNHNDSLLNMKLNGQETSEQKDNNKINQNTSQNQGQQNGRSSIQVFESINIYPNDINSKQANKSQNDFSDENAQDLNNQSSKKTSQQRFQRMFNLIKQRGNKLENSPQTDDKQLEVVTKENQQEENAISNDNNQQSQTQIIHKSSMFSKLVNNNPTNNMTGQSSYNFQISELSSPKINKQLSISKGFSLFTEDQAKLEQEEQQKEEEIHINQIRKRFCEKYMFSKIFGSLSAENIQCPEKLIHFPSFVFKYYYQRTLNQGSTFGELGLLDGKPRSAYILCAEDCEFGVMEKEDYQLLLGNIHRRELERKFNFLKDHMLQELTNQALKKIFYNFQKIKVQKNEYIFKQGTLSDGIYLIKKGDVKLEKTLTYQEQISSEGENGISMMRKVQTTKKNTPFATLSSGEYFGEEFLIFDFKSKHYRSYSAVASSMKTSLYFMQSSTFTVFLKQFPELFMAFKKSVTFKIERRQEYMEKIEQNYKETMKQKEAINNQHQSDLKIIQSLQSQKSQTDMSCASPMSQQHSPLIKRTASQQYLIKQLSQQGCNLACENPKVGQFESCNKPNINERNSLLFYCSPSIKLSIANNSIADFDNIVNSSKSIVIQSSQPQLKFKLISNSNQEQSAKILNTLHQIDQKQIDDEEDINNKQQKIEISNIQPYPQPKLIKLVSTQNINQIPEKNAQQSEKNNELLMDSNISPIQGSRIQSPTQNTKLKLMSEIMQNEQLLSFQGGQKQSEKKFTRNSQHSNTLSCIEKQSSLLQEQLNTFVYKRDKHKSQTSIMHIQSEELESPLLNQKQNTQQNQKKQQVIRQNEFEELEELEDLLDVQYFQTKYNPEKLEELLLYVEKLKAEHKTGRNVIENKLEFLYNKNVKEVKMRINLIKQKIQNAFRKDLSHENQQYQSNRKNIYSNSPSKSVDKITKLSQRYLKQQDQYDKIIRSKITERQKTNSIIQKESNQISEAIDMQNTVKEIPKIFVNNSDEILKKSSSIDSKYTYQNEKNIIDRVNSNNNLDFCSQINIASIKMEQKNQPNQNLIQLASSQGSRTNLVINTYENGQSTNKMIISAPFKGSSLSPLKTSPNSPKIRPKSRNKSGLIQLKLNPSSKNQFFNFNILNYQSSRQNVDFNPTNGMFQQFQLKTQNSNLIMDQSQLTPLKTQISTSQTQVQPSQENLESQKINTIQLQQKEKKINSSQSAFMTPDVSERRNKTTNRTTRQRQKMFLIKSQSNTALTQSHNPFLNTKQSKQENNKSSDSQTVFNKKSEDLKQSYFLKHRKTQSHIIFDIAPSFQNQKAPFLCSNSSVSPTTKLNQQDQIQNSLSIKNRYEKQEKVNLSLTNFNEIKTSENSLQFIHHNQNLNVTDNNSNNKILQKSSSKKQIQISQQNIKLKEIVQNSFNYTNETQQNPYPNTFQQNQNNINTKYIELKKNFSMLNQNQIKLIKNNSILVRRKMHNPLQIFKGSKTNSSITVKSFLASTNSPLFNNNSVLKYNFLQQNQLQ